MIALTATMPPSIQNTMMMFVILTTSVAVLYGLVLVYGVKKLRPTVSTRLTSVQPRPLNTAPAQKALAKPVEDAQLLEYRKRLERLDEAVKLIEEKLKTPVKQTEDEQQVLEDTGVVEGVEELRKVLDLAKSLRDEISKISLGEVPAEKPSNSRKKTHEPLL
ncbi:MAG: hypothetical protein QW362_00760 [Candidatus Caldarchaeum sp.]